MPGQSHRPKKTDPTAHYDEKRQMCMAPQEDNAFVAAQLGLAPQTSSSGPASGSKSTGGPAAGTSPAAGPAAATRPDLANILKTYQVDSDTMTDWGPTGLSWLTGTKKMTQTEADLLDQLQWRKGLMGLNDFKNIKDQAYEVSGSRYKKNNDAGKPGAEDGHQDAFRHIYWNVMMTKKFGPDFAKAFGTAHEGVPGNPGAREAMDLYNNELGRKIVAENPDASLEDLQDLVGKAITDGRAVVIDKKGDIQWSDSIKVGETGTTSSGTLPGKQKPPAWTGST